LSVPKAGIIYNDVKPIASSVAIELKDKLTAAGWDVYITASIGGILGYSQPDSPVLHTPIEGLTPPGFDSDMKFAVVLGGDGTVLAASRLVAPCGIPMLTVNTGHMGFLTEAYLNQLPQALEQCMAGAYQVEDRAMLTVKVMRGDTVKWEALC
jgi:NAD+ kinase